MKDTDGGKVVMARFLCSCCFVFKIVYFLELQWNNLEALDSKQFSSQNSFSGEKENYVGAMNIQNELQWPFEVLYKGIANCSYGGMSYEWKRQEKVSQLQLLCHKYFRHYFLLFKLKNSSHFSLFKQQQQETHWHLFQLILFNCKYYYFL